MDYLPISATRPAASILTLAFAYGVLYLAFRVIYRLFLHPLSAFPGPRLAGATSLWKAYYQCTDSFAHQLMKLHEIYGPVVRIRPNELHFKSTDAFFDIYNNKNRWDKDAALYHSFGEDESSFGYISHVEAKERRDVLSRIFSVKAVEEAEPLIRLKVNNFCAALARQNAAGKPADLLFAFRCVTMDVITYLCFGQSGNAVDEPDFHDPLIEAMHNSTALVPLFFHFKIIRKLIMGMPPEMAKKSAPETAGLINMQQLLKKQIDGHVNDPETLEALPHKTTIYHILLDPNSHKSRGPATAKSLYEESQALMFGGGDTTANVVMIGAFYLLKRPDLIKKLKDELKEYWPELGPGREPKLSILEEMPFFNAVIKESLRIGPGLPSGLPRIVPAAGAIIDGKKVAGGTVVSTSAWFVHHNASIFPEPDVFKPERWQSEQAKELEKYLVPFSKGTRMCLGFNLGWAELRMIFAHTFRKFDLELADERYALLIPYSFPLSGFIY
ncbi:uncharacterized protein A1O9_01854 [Exophiala aquamarina CBS 119918]|uniref:Cytochrome P450 oxidoreductase n=1 Tax=Exophiala aquamarina CBS 119918 TaxID=1182545 RepID=A0A072PVI3_9EURO|nr:uncharacterized protein A1O9_01854 [Exophiala aquamarina CBS 119918]KEF63876.1 hypothetical protein A1O9_01854 [Exophiala aquamarina CBS 119918]